MPDIPTFIADEDLHEEPHSSSRYHNFAQALRANMGQWATYPAAVKSPSSTAARINNDAFGSLPCTDFEAKVVLGQVYVRFWPEEMRGENVRKRRHDTQAPPPPKNSTETWAVRMFERLGPQRAEVVYKMLSRVLHPDMPHGDKTLMQELNDARTR